MPVDSRPSSAPTWRSCHDAATAFLPERPGRRSCRGCTAGSCDASARRTSSSTRKPWPTATRSRSREPSGLGLEEGVQAALDLARPRPAAVALVLAGDDGSRARLAPDAGVALVEERMRRDPVTLHVVVGVLRRPGRHRVHLAQVSLERFDRPDALPRARLVAPPPIHPGAHAREESLPRLHFVDVAVEVRVTRVE